MALRRNQEAEKLWQQMLAVERIPSKTPEDFQRKKKEMEKLKVAYAKASGTDHNPTSFASQEEAEMRVFNQRILQRKDTDDQHGR